MISEDEREKRRQAYLTAKANSKARGVELTPETEALMSRYIDGEISQETFFAEVGKVALQALGANKH